MSPLICMNRFALRCFLIENETQYKHQTVFKKLFLFIGCESVLYYEVNVNMQVVSASEIENDNKAT